MHGMKGMKMLGLPGPVLDRVIAERMASHHTPLFRAVRGGAALIHIEPKERFTRWELLTGRGWIAVIDDRAGRGVGPAGFHDATVTHLTAVTSLAVVSSGQPCPSLYEAGGAAALDGGRVLIVETSAARHRAWMRFVRGLGPRAVLLFTTAAGATAAGAP